MLHPPSAQTAATPQTSPLYAAQMQARDANEALIELINLLDRLSRRIPLHADAAEWEEVDALCERVHSRVGECENEFVKAMGEMMIGDAPQARPGEQPSGAGEVGGLSGTHD